MSAMSSCKYYITIISLLVHRISSTAPTRHLQWQTLDNEGIGTHPIPWHLETGFVTGYKDNDIYVLNSGNRYKFNTETQAFFELDQGTERNWEIFRTMKSQAYTQVNDRLYFADLRVFDMSTETLSSLPYTTSLDTSFSCLTSNELQVPSSVQSQNFAFYGTSSLGQFGSSNTSANTVQFLYTTGGGSTSSTNDVLSSQFYIWNLGTNSIMRGPDMPNAREYHSCVVVNDTLYVIGGNTENKVKTDSIISIDISDMSDVDNWQWIELDAKLSVARAGLRSVVFEQWIYVVGGYTSQSTDAVDNVDIIDTIDGTIMEEVPLDIAVAFPGAINVNDRLYVFGGSDTHITDDDEEDGIGEEILQYALLPIDLPKPKSVISSTVTTIYFVLNVVFIIVLSILIYMTSEDKGLKSLAKTIWARKGIYGEVMAHILDTACDIGVLVDWYLLSTDGFGYTIDMESLFWAAIGCQIWYRTMSCCYAYSTPAGVSRQEEPKFCVDAPLACLDMYIIKTVYESFKSKDTESNPRQNSIQVLEALLESSPQIVFQSVFLARAYGTILGDQGNVPLTVVSLIMSIYSVGSKYAALDKQVVIEDAQSLNFKAKWPCVSFTYVLRTLWRSSYIISRMLLFVLIWVVIGGQAFAIYFGSMTMIWFVMMCCVPTENHSVRYYLMCVVCIAVPATHNRNTNCYRFFEMILFMIVVTAFYSSDTICDDLGEFCDLYRSVSGDGNTFTKLFLVAAWILMVIDFVLFFVIRKMGILLEEFTMTDVFQLFIDGQELDPTAQHGDKPKSKTADTKDERDLESGKPSKTKEKESKEAGKGEEDKPKKKKKKKKTAK